MLIIGRCNTTGICRKIEEKHTDHSEAVREYETTINLYAASAEAVDIQTL